MEGLPKFCLQIFVSLKICAFNLRRYSLDLLSWSIRLSQVSRSLHTNIDTRDRLPPGGYEYIELSIARFSEQTIFFQLSSYSHYSLAKLYVIIKIITIYVSRLSYILLNLGDHFMLFSVRVTVISVDHAFCLSNAHLNVFSDSSASRISMVVVCRLSLIFNVAR